MSRTFDGNSSNYISLGDITAARFGVDTDYSWCSFFNIADITTDDSTLIAKWGSASNTRQFTVVVQNQSPPSFLKVEADNENMVISTGTSPGLVEDTWYFILVTHNGTSNTTTVYVWDVSDQSIVDDGLTGTHDTDSAGVTQPIEIGKREGPADVADGLISCNCYFGGELSKAEGEFLLNDLHGALPYMKEKYGVQFALCLEGTESPEPDWGGLGNDGTVNGTLAKGVNPPVRWLGERNPFVGVTVPAGGSETLTADSASYAWTGTAANLEHHKLISAEAGSYAWTGQAATLLKSTLVTAEAGSYAWTGTTANLEHHQVISAVAGSYAWTGQDATLTHLTGEILTAEAGSYAWTGQTVNLLHDNVLSAEAGSYAWTGIAATLTVVPVVTSIWTATTPASTSWSEESAASSTWTPTGKASTDWTET